MMLLVMLVEVAHAQRTHRFTTRGGLAEEGVIQDFKLVRKGGKSVAKVSWLNSKGERGIPYEALHPSSQRFVQSWLEDEVRAGRKKLQFEVAKPSRSKIGQPKTVSIKEFINNRLETSSEVYEIRLENESGVPVAGLRLDYIVILRESIENDFTKAHRPELEKGQPLEGREKQRFQESAKFIAGRVSLSEMMPKEQLTIHTLHLSTKKHTYTTKQLDPVWHPLDAKRKIGEDPSFDNHTILTEVEGIRLRLYHGETLVVEPKPVGSAFANRQPANWNSQLYHEHPATHVERE